MSWCTCSHRKSQHATDALGRMGVGRCLAGGARGCMCTHYVAARLIGGPLKCHLCRAPATTETLKVVELDGAEVLVHAGCWERRPKG